MLVHSVCSASTPCMYVHVHVYVIGTCIIEIDRTLLFSDIHVVLAVCRYDHVVVCTCM